MRFGLRCVITLAILYRAILVSQGGAGTAALSAKLAEAAPIAQARVRDAVGRRVDAWCRNDPAACVTDAAHLASLVAGGTVDPVAAPRHGRQGAVAAATR